MRSMTLPAVLAAMLLLTSCASSGRAVTEGACAAFRPILIGRGDVLTAETARQILAHDQAGARICGWKPGGDGHAG